VSKITEEHAPCRCEQKYGIKPTICYCAEKARLLKKSQQIEIDEKDRTTVFATKEELVSFLQENLKVELSLSSSPDDDPDQIIYAGLTVYFANTKICEDSDFTIIRYDPAFRT